MFWAARPYLAPEEAVFVEIGVVKELGQRLEEFPEGLGIRGRLGGARQK